MAENASASASSRTFIGYPFGALVGILNALPNILVPRPPNPPVKKLVPAPITPPSTLDNKFDRSLSARLIAPVAACPAPVASPEYEVGASSEALPVSAASARLYRSA